MSGADSHPSENDHAKPGFGHSLPRQLRSTLTALIFLVVWVVILTRAIPGRSGDRGVFISVAERINAGDALYVDVWDNKDPLFFLLLAAGRTVSPYLDFVIEVLWLIVAGIAGYSIGRVLSLSRLSAVLAGGAGVPLILVGGEYIAGFTHLPGSSLTLAITALALRNRYLLVGVLLVALALFKLIMLPLAVIALIPIAWRTRQRASLLYLTSGVALSLVSAALLLAARGELAGYLSQIVSNFTYAGGHYMPQDANPVLIHLEYTITSSAMVTIGGILVILALTYVPRSLWRESGNTAVLWQVVLVTLVVSLGIIALTGLRYHHAQVIYPTAALALMLATASLPNRLSQGWSPLVSTPFLALILAGGLAPQILVTGAQGSLTKLRDLQQSPNTTAALLERSTASSYARIGDNMDEGLARGLDQWELACPRFAQYGTDTAEVLQETTSCLPTAEFVVVHPSFAQVTDWPRGYLGIESFDVWNSWVRETELVLQEDFTCEEFDEGRICSRR